MKNRTLLVNTGIITILTGVLGGASLIAGCSGSQGNASSATTEASSTEPATSNVETTASKKADSGKTEEKQVKLQVVDKEGKVSEYDEATDAEYLRGVLDEISEDSDFSYSGSESQYGLMIDTVNGEQADYTKDGAYWSIYVNDEYANYGVDSQPVADGDTFALKYEAAK